MTLSGPERTFEILLIEDNPGDVFLLKRALERSSTAHLTTARDGEEAMELLHQRATTPELGLPDLIMLDLQLPRMDGYQVLVGIRNDPLLRAIPVVVFSSSDAELDIMKSYALGANCYVPKPFELARFNEMVGSIVHFWLHTALLPKPRALTEQFGRENLVL